MLFYDVTISAGEGGNGCTNDTTGVRPSSEGFTRTRILARALTKAVDRYIPIIIVGPSCSLTIRKGVCPRKVDLQAYSKPNKKNESPVSHQTTVACCRWSSPIAITNLQSAMVDQD